MVIAVLLILPWSTAPGRALLAILSWLLALRLLLGPSTTHLVLLVATLVVIPVVHPRLVLVVVLLLILIPAGATCGS